MSIQVEPRDDDSFPPDDDIFPCKCQPDSERDQATLRNEAPDQLRVETDATEPSTVYSEAFRIKTRI